MKFSESLRSFLCAQPPSDLIERVLRHFPAEVQVNLREDVGEAIEETKGRMIDGFHCFPVRYPRNSGTAPAWTNDYINWPLDIAAEEIGATGFTQQGSLWVGFDFDAISGHAAGVGISDAELARVRDAAQELKYVESRRSTSGSGLHLYVLLDPIATTNHAEHTSVARAVLEKMSRDSGFDFSASVDCVGGVMWFWSRRATVENQGLTLLSPAQTRLSEADIPEWKSLVKPVRSEGRPTIEHDDEHRRIIESVRKHGPVIFDHEIECYRIHTSAAKATHVELGLKGAFETVSEGTDLCTPNAFAFLRPQGVVYIERFGTDREHPLWGRAKSGHACILFNSPARPEAVCRAVGATWIGNGFTCPDGKSAKLAAGYLGIDLPHIGERHVNFRFGDGLIVECDRSGKESPPGWGIKGRRLVKHFSIDAPEVEGHDDIVRHLVSPTNEDAGWEVCRADGSYGVEPISTVRSVLETALGKSNVAAAITWCCKNPFMLANEPFQPTMLPGRRLNRGRQLVPATTGGKYEHFTMILDHVGRGLDKAVKSDDWCEDNGVERGADYLRLWLASKVQRPKQPLPFLFFWSEEQNTGKSSFYRAAGMLFQGGCTDVFQALVEQFNQQMAGALIGVIEERTLPANVYGKLKAWVDSPTIAIRAMRENQYTLPNYCAFIQTSNDRNSCPLEPGDQRIVVIPVFPLVKSIPWYEEMEPALRREAGDFLGMLFSIRLPPAAGRLFLPVLTTEDKLALMKIDRKAAVRALKDKLSKVDFWCGTAQALVIALGKGAWPSDPAALGTLLDEVGQGLAEHGMTIVRQPEGHDRTRMIYVLPSWMA